MQIYARRLSACGGAPKGITAYRYQLRSTLHSASRLRGRSVTIAQLFKDATLLGRSLVDDLSRDQVSRLSKWTLAQRRSAVRSFATLMRPELLSLLGEDPHCVLDRALRSVAERVGGGYRLTGGAPRRRGGWVPTAGEVDQILADAGRAPGFVGARNAAFFAILAATGARVNALRLLEGSDCLVMPSGRLRVFLQEKGKAERREVELSHGLSAALRMYIDGFNLHASRIAWRARIRLGEAGPVWRNSDRGRWPYRDVLATLRALGRDAGVPEFTPHALRRAFATDAASELPRHVVALAGGWQGVDRLDDHYVRPRAPTIWEKLRHGEDRDGEPIGTTGEAAAAFS